MTSNQFYSCSIVKQTAQAFAVNGILMVIHTSFAINIGEDSAFPGEKEYVIPPGMLFEITNTVKRSSKNNYDELTLKMVEVKLATNVNPDLVIDMSKEPIRVQLYNGSSKQKWFIQGRYIRSSYNG